MGEGFSRRELVRRGLLATPLVAALSWAARAAEAPRFGLGLVTYNVAKDWDLDTILRVCGEAGLPAVEFRTTHAHGVERTLAAAERAEVKRKCKAAGLRQTSLGSVCEFHSPDPEVVKRNVADCRAWVELARDIGARAVKVRPNGLPPDVPEAKTLEQIGHALAECGDHAKQNGVEIWVEVHGEGTRLPPRMRRIMDACSHPSVGLTWNSNDTDVAAGSVEVAWGLLGRFVRCAHITDLASGYPYRELFGLFECSGFAGFTLCEYPKPVQASEGASWLKDYKRSWEALTH
jgi:hypothetical protein